MAKSEVNKCMEWLFDQQGEMESASFGRGKLGVMEALVVQQSKVKDIMKFQGEVMTTLKMENVDGKAARDLTGQLSSVKALSDKRESCLGVIGQIASLEDLVTNLSGEFDSRAVHLVNSSQASCTSAGPNQSNESLARTAQNCISSVRQNWRWVFQTMQCAEVHLRNAAAYQQFFQEVSEAEHWMSTTLSRIHQSFNKAALNGDLGDAKRMLAEIKDVLSAYLQWQTKIDYLYDKAKEVVPVPLRVKGIKEPRAAISLTDFSSNEIGLMEGETLTLLENSDSKKWKVKNNNGEEGQVPAVILLIPPPCGDAMDAATRLKLQLLALWTGSVKRLGYQMIAFMLLVFKDWSEDEIALLQAMSASDRAQLLRILNFIESELMVHWAGYGDFDELQERILRLKMILEDAPEANGHGNDQFTSTVVVQMQTLEELMRKYKDFWTFWETYKCMVEAMRSPRFMLVCDKWEQLRFVTSAHYIKFWDTELDINKEQLTKSMSSLVMHETPKEALPSVSSEVTVEERMEESTQEQVHGSLVEEETTFIIKGILDPRDEATVLTLDKAVQLGIIDQAKKTYVNPKNGHTMSMSDATNEGRIMMELVSRKKIREEKNTYGLITLKITKETRPYTITGVIDPSSDMTLTTAEAQAKGIYDTNTSTYRTESGDKLSIGDAIHSGLVMVEYHEGEARGGKPDVEEKTYSVHGVVDQKKKCKVSFTDAMRDGLLDRETGEYVNNVTGVHVAVHEAIMKGFIKARVVTDPSKLEMNPENVILVEKQTRTLNKLRGAVRLAAAMKK